MLQQGQENTPVRRAIQGKEGRDMGATVNNASRVDVTQSITTGQPTYKELEGEVNAAKDDLLNIRRASDEYRGAARKLEEAKARAKLKRDGVSADYFDPEVEKAWGEVTSILQTPPTQPSIEYDMYMEAKARLNKAQERFSQNPDRQRQTYRILAPDLLDMSEEQLQERLGKLGASVPDDMIDILPEELIDTYKNWIKTELMFRQKKQQVHPTPNEE